MARPDAALLDPARYTWRFAMTSRFADMDPNRHFNNVALAAMLEDGRVRFNTESSMIELLDGLRPMVASVAIEYLAQGFYPDPVEVLVATEAVNRSSWSVVQVLLQGERTVAFARTVIVATDGHRSAPLPDAFRAELQRWMLA